MTQRYDTYKDSGVQWLGEIPGHWRHVALSKVSEIILGKMLQGETKNETDTLFPYICAKDVHFDGIDVSDLKTMYFSQSEMELYGVLKGDMLIVEGGAGAGNCSILREEVKKTGIQNSIMIVRSNDDALNDYICYFMSSIVRKGYVDFITNVATIPHFTKEKVSRTNIPLPPLSEQHAIVSYLDDKCGKIDKMLEGKQKQIELLAEMKQRIIADAVTHGLNPDVKMKATNIPWLPEIPEHWEMKRTKYLLKLLNESTKRTRKIGLENIESNSGKYILTESIFDGDGVDFDRGDILYGKLRPYLNKVWLAEFDGNAVGDFYVYRAINGYLNSFAKYFLMSSCFVGISNASTYGAKMPRVSSQFIHSLHFPVPPLSEQRAIVSYLDDKTAKIDALTGKLQQEIESIKEYKQRLISDVVTGQIKVC